MARTAVVAGTATAVSNRVSRRQADRWSQQDAQAYGQPDPGYAEPPPAPAAPAADPIESIRQLGRAYVGFAVNNPNHFRFMFMSPQHHKDEAHTPEDPGWRSFGALLDAVKRGVAAGRFKAVDPLTAAQVLWMNVHGVACALITMPPAQWPHGPAANDLVDQVIENGIRGLLVGPGKA